MTLAGQSVWPMGSGSPRLLQRYRAGLPLPGLEGYVRRPGVGDAAARCSSPPVMCHIVGRFFPPCCLWARPGPSAIRITSTLSSPAGIMLC